MRGSKAKAMRAVAKRWAAIDTNLTERQAYKILKGRPQKNDVGGRK